MTNLARPEGPEEDLTVRWLREENCRLRQLVQEEQAKTKRLQERIEALDKICGGIEQLEEQIAQAVREKYAREEN